MSKFDEARPVVGESAAVPAPAATVVSHHEGEDGMGELSEAHASINVPSTLRHQGTSRPPLLGPSVRSSC